MKHFKLLVFSVLAALAFTVSPINVSLAALSPPNTEFSVSVDFAEEELGPYPIGWDGETGVITDELDDYPVAAGEVVELDFNVLGTLEALGSSWVVVHRVLSADATIAPGGFSATAGAGAAPISYQQMVLVAEDDGSVIGLWVYTCSGHSNCTVSGSNSAEIVNPTDLYVYSHDIFVSGTINTISIVVDAETNPFFGGGTGEGTYKSISSPDIFSIIDNNLTVWANKTNPNVHAITSGEIGTIQHNMFGGSTWSVTVTPSWSDEPGDVMRYDNLQSINGKVGDEIIAGCVLGLASTSSTGGSYPVGKLTMTLPDNIQEDWPDYPDSPSNLPCDVASQQTPNCVNINPNFANDADSWNSEGHVETNPQGVTLFSGAAIYQDVVLDDVNTYGVTIFATTTFGSTTSADLLVTFGEASASLHLSVPTATQWVKLETQTLSIGAADFAPDLYRLRIQNVPPLGHLATPVMIKFVCIGTDAVVTAPGDCFFDDPNVITDSWEKEGGATYEEPQGNSLTGTYTIPADGAIFQVVDISAFVDADTDFTLVTQSFNGDGTPLIGPYGRWHAYIRDSTTEDLLQEIGEWDTLPVILTIKRQNFTLTEGEHVVGDLVIENTSADITSPGWDLKINHACLQVEGGVWPGYGNDDTGSLFTPDCAICSQPGGLDDITTNTLLSWVVMWLQFGWCYLGYILKCLVLTALNNIWGTVLSVIAGIGLFGVWVGMVVSALAAWGADGLRFLINNLVASIIPIANLVIAWLFSLPFIQTLVDVVGIAAIWLQALYDVVIGVINLFILGIQLIGALLALVGRGWQAFLDAMTGTSAVTSFPFPDCTNPATPFYDACLPIDVANFVFTEIPMLAALLNAIAFAVAWKTLRKAWRDTQDALSS